MRSASPGRRRGGSRSSARWPARSSRRPRRARGSRRAAAGPRSGPQPTGIGRCRDRGARGSEHPGHSIAQLSSAAACSSSNCCSTAARSRAAARGPAGRGHLQAAGQQAFLGGAHVRHVERGEQIVGGDTSAADTAARPRSTSIEPGRDWLSRLRGQLGDGHREFEPLAAVRADAERAEHAARSSARAGAAAAGCVRRAGRAPSCSRVAARPARSRASSEPGAARARVRLAPTPPAAAHRPVRALFGCLPVGLPRPFPPARDTCARRADAVTRASR